MGISLKIKKLKKKHIKKALIKPKKKNQVLLDFVCLTYFVKAHTKGE